MPPDDRQPMTEDELSALLRKWTVTPAPASLEARIFGPRAATRKKLWALAVAAAVLAGLAIWAVQSAWKPPPPPRARLVASIPPAPLETSQSAKALPHQSQAHVSVPSTPPKPEDRVMAVDPPPLPDGPRAEEVAGPKALFIRRLPPEKLMQSRDAVYPPAARAAGIEGTVTLEVRIGADGHVIESTLISGSPQLARAAIDAVSHWVYRPTLLNGQPVEVLTHVDVKFALAPQ